MKDIIIWYTDLSLIWQIVYGYFFVCGLLVGFGLFVFLMVRLDNWLHPEERKCGQRTDDFDDLPLQERDLPAMLKRQAD